MMDFHKGRWRLALGRLVNLRYINRWIIFSADLFVSLSVSLLGVLGMFSILHIRIGEPDVLKVGLSSFVGSIVSFLLFKAYHGVIRHSTLRGLWRIGGAAIGKSLLMFLLLWLLKARFSPSIYWLGGIMDSSIMRFAKSAIFTGSPISKIKISPPLPIVPASNTRRQASGMVMK